MPDPDLFSDPNPAAPWHIDTEHLGGGGASIHTLYHLHTPTEQRTGPHGLSILSDIRDHLNQCGGKPAPQAHTDNRQPSQPPLIFPET